MSRFANRWHRPITRAMVAAIVALYQQPAPAPGPVQKPVRWRAPRKPKGSVALPPPAKKATKRDVMLRAEADREARELEQPVDSLPGMKPERVVRAVPKQATPIITAIIDKANKAERTIPKFTLPPNPLEARRQRLQRAIDWLNQHAWFVQVVNREAAVRTYRVAGKRDAMLAEDVIRVAIEKGMEP